jgi:hypothetical protein
MDYRRQTQSFLSLALFCSALAASAADTGLRAARWLPADRQEHALSYAPAECLSPGKDKTTANKIAIGRAAFRTPLLLGGQAARAGLSCDSCHRNGRGNPDFLFPGLSGAPGTADVTSSLMSSHRGDGIFNPTPIPDLSGPVASQKISRDVASQKLEQFIRGLIVEEFDGPEPSALTLDSLAMYIRHLTPEACKTPTEKKIQLDTYLSDARHAMQAALYSYDAGDAVTSRLMIASARTALGFVHERYSEKTLFQQRQALQQADLELAAIQHAIDKNDNDISLRITTWLIKMPRWETTLKKKENLSLFSASVLPDALQAK